MAIIDKRSELASAVALSTAATGLALVGSQYDLGSIGHNVGAGKQLYLVLRVSTSVTSAGAATVAFSLVSDAQAAIAVDGSATVHFTSAAIPKATLVAGYTIAVIALPIGVGITYERYLGILQNVGTAALTAGAIDAFLTYDPPENWKSYADATN